MQEYKILVPVTDNNGNSTDEYFDVLKRRILEVFGGYTEGAECTGAWHNGDKAFYDRVVPLYVAVDTSKQSPLQLEVMVYVYIVGGMKQECAYLKHPDGSVQFVSEEIK